jgi:hypothetical protein
MTKTKRRLLIEVFEIGSDRSITLGWVISESMCSFTIKDITGMTDLTYVKDRYYYKGAK